MHYIDPIMQHTTRDAWIVATRRSIDARYVAAVSARLGAAVTLIRYDVDKYGASIPVFSVPADCRARAESLGLRTWSTDHEA